MTLATHAVAGAVAAQLVPAHPLLAFLAGLLSHFIVDAIPHGHYKLISDLRSLDVAQDVRMKDKNFLIDLLRIGLDFAFGLTLVLILFNPPNYIDWTILLGALAGVLPDPLLFAAVKIPQEPLVALGRFHRWIHAKKRYDGQIAKTILVEILMIITAVSILTLRP